MADICGGNIALWLISRLETAVIYRVTNRQAAGAARHWRIQNATQTHLTCAPFFMEN